MEKNLYIDASHPNETRVVLKSGDNIEDYEYEGLKNNLITNNIFLGKVTRVEPSFHAAFIDFGRDKHGFLSFNYFQPDYYQIQQIDLFGIKEEEEKEREKLLRLSLIHISDPTRLGMTSYAAFCLKKKKQLHNSYSATYL